MKRLKTLAVITAFSAALASTPGYAHVDEYDDSQSHPLRLAAYLLHPAGVILEWTFFRPFHYLTSATPALETLFGHRHHPPVLEDAAAHNYGVPRKIDSHEKQTVDKRVAAQEPVAENVKIVEIPVEKTIVKEVAKVIEVERLVFPDVAFRFNSAELTDLGRGKVYLAAQKLREKSELTIVIEGHTDNVGHPDYNQQLGLRRAQRVMSELAALGIDAQRMSMASVGHTKPLIDEDTSWARAINRRVEFQVNSR